MKKKIHVNQHNIRANLKNGDSDLAVITVKTYKSNTYGHTVAIHGNSAVVYPDKPLSCGARVWIETAARVTVYDRDGELVGDIP
jgi:hypothetical protein